MSVAGRLRGGRAAAARGHLSLDREKAREKLRMFRLPDPHFYVLQFVRAASVLGAKRIDFEISASKMTCRFDKDLDPELLQDLWSVAFESRSDPEARAVHYVALGLGSAQALNPAQIDLHTADLTAYIYSDSETIVERRKHTGAGTVIFVREKFRFGHIVEYFQSIGGQLAEVRALELRCQMAPIEVRVNRRSNRELGGQNLDYTKTIDTEQSKGFLALDAIAVDGWCSIFKDGVMLERIPVPNHGRAAIAMLQSADVQTDLSGLALIKEDNWDAPLHDVVIPQYHAALLEWSQSHGVELLAERLDMLAEVCDYTKDRGVQPSPQTQKLFDHLAAQPLFQSALKISPRNISIDEASTPLVVRYSKQRFPKVQLDDGDVLLVEPYAQAGPHDARMRMLWESAVAALAGSGLRRTVDITDKLERRSMAKRNRAMWEEREPQVLGEHRYTRQARVGPRTGYVFLPLNGPSDPVRDEAQGYFGFHESKLLRHHPGQLAIGTQFGGQLGVNLSFSDVIRGDEFGKLAALLCGQTLGLHQELARELISSGAEEHRRPRILDEFVLALHKGDWCARFMSDVGFFLDAQIRKVIDENTGALANVLWFGQSRPRDELIERLGPIADVRSIELADGSRCSLADALKNADLCLLQPTGDWRTFLAKTRETLPPTVLANIAIADEVQRKLLHELRAVPDARMVIDRLLARSRFFAREPYVLQKPANVALEETRSSSWFESCVMLIPGGEQGLCITTFVWRGRVLGHRRFDVPMGSFEAVVWSDEFEPTAFFDNVRDDPRVTEVGQYLVGKSAELLDEWWTTRCRDADAGRGADFDLFVDVAWELAPRHAELRVLPVLEQNDAQWTPALASRNELRAVVSRCGLVLSYTRGLSADKNLLADPGAPVIRIGSRHVPEDLNQVLGYKLRFVDATTVGTATRVPPKEFWAKPARPMRIEGAAVEWEGTIRGIVCHCGLYHSQGQDHSPGAQIDVLTATAAELQQLNGVGPNIASSIILLRGHSGITKPEDLLRVPGIGPAIFDRIKTEVTVGQQMRESRTSNLVEVLVQGRRLESLDVETPMGKFRTTMTGEPIVPDPTYKFAAGGRDKILLAAHAAAAHTIRAACEQARDHGSPPREIVPDLRRFLWICQSESLRPPFDLVDELRSTPMFPTLNGNWLALDWLGGIARDNVLYWASTGNREDVLELTEEELPLVEALLAGSLKLRFTESGWGVTSEAQTEAPANIEGDPILDTVIDLLLIARGDRNDLFDDQLALNVRWVQLDRELCRVAAGGVDVNPDHPLARAVVEQSDIGACAFLASSVYSAINAYYRQITDHDELELQSRLVRGMS